MRTGILFTMLFLGFGFCLAGFSRQAQKMLPLKPKQDTITFSLRWDVYNGCDAHCYMFLGSGDIKTINGKAVKGFCTQLFLQCPTTFQLRKDTVYTFLARRFTVPACATTIDTCINNRFYFLVKKLE
jgi:hypothetical protein